MQCTSWFTESNLSARCIWFLQFEFNRLIKHSPLNPIISSVRVLQITALRMESLVEGVEWSYSTFSFKKQPPIKKYKKDELKDLV